MIKIARTQGAYLHTNDGKCIIDGISSWWVNTHGHNHPRIVEAVRAQAGNLDQVIFAGFTHEPAEQVAAQLLQLTDQHFSNIFLSDSGSTAVEVALKMAIGYWAHQGQKRAKILALDHAYHGDTFGAMATGARSVFNNLYADYLFDIIRLPFPLDAQILEKIFQEEAHNIAAFIFEPLVLGAGGMLMYDAQTLRRMMGLCKTYHVLTIADEVMTGFGRTGTLFACQQAGLWPDLMCLSKGLTGGFLPLGATLATQQIYEVFYDDDRSKMFFHSSSFTGNPLACAAAAASLSIWQEEPVVERLQAIHTAHTQARTQFQEYPAVQDIRLCGTILALDLADSAQNYLSELAPKLYRFFLENGVLLRPLGNTVYILPPYCVTQDDLELIYDCIKRALDDLGHDRRQRAI